MGTRCDLDWDYTSVWILSLSLTDTHRPTYTHASFQFHQEQGVKYKVPSDEVMYLPGEEGMYNVYLITQPHRQTSTDIKAHTHTCNRCDKYL